MLAENTVHRSDIFDLCSQIDDASIDMILCDLPYGTTACAWDTIIPFDLMWTSFERIIKPNAAIVLTASQPFTSALVMSNVDLFKYEWIWQKSKGANFVHAKNMPIKFHESVLVFSKAPIGHISQLGMRRMNYNPQGLIKVDKRWTRPQKYENGHKLKRESHTLDRVIEYENYPTSLLKFSNSNNRERGLHPTQKPVALFDYLIRTYTKTGDIVFDPCVGSGTTAVAARDADRNFIVGDTDQKYVETTLQRLNK